jgi:Na+/H+-translocating membrane pyrophosphatase
MAAASSTELILGMSIGMSTVLPTILVLATTMYVAFTVADVLGIALLALGTISILPVYITIGR